MAAYIIVDLLEISDPATFQDYAQKAGPTVGKYSGKALVVRGKLETLEGQWKPGSVVVLEFPSVARAKEWYNSAEYQPLRAQRWKSSKANMILAEGV
ncbi:MAG: DUF1330 domain-containing protein [Candidatus Omnitrophica bacterium]|nr:DUF1330 domain-containing protein [Candidatus Omnitrophota bacterium]